MFYLNSYPLSTVISLERVNVARMKRGKIISQTTLGLSTTKKEVSNVVKVSMGIGNSYSKLSLSYSFGIGIVKKSFIQISFIQINVRKN